MRDSLTRTLVSILIISSLACGGQRRLSDESARKAAIAAASVAIAGYIYWRMQPRAPDFHTACGIPVHSPGRTLSGAYRADMHALITEFVDEHAQGDCSSLSGVTIALVDEGELDCRAAASGHCTGTYNPRTRAIRLLYHESFARMAILTELQHAVHGTEGLWDHRFGTHLDAGP